MRIKASALGKPDYEYVTILKGHKVIVKIYHEPQYCVQIITEKDKQCYPLTFEQYNNYCDNAEMILHPSKAALDKLTAQAYVKATTFDSDPNLKRFWINVYNHYKGMGGEC